MSFLVGMSGNLEKTRPENSCWHAWDIQRELLHLGRELLSALCPVGKTYALSEVDLAEKGRSR